MDWRVLKQVLLSAAVYLAVAIGWIVLSDWLITLSLAGPEQIQRFQTYKGIGFVVITTGLLVMLLYRHLSEREQAEAELEARRQSTETLLQNLPCLVYRCDVNRDWTMEFMSDATLQITGYPPSALESDRVVSYGDLILPEHRDYVWHSVNDAVQRDVPFQLNYPIRCQDRSIRWVWEQGRKVVGPDGRPRLEGVIFDVTDRHERDEEIRRRLEEISRLNEEMRVILDNAPVMAVFYGAGAVPELKWANRCWERTLGWNVEDARRRNILEDIYPDPRTLRLLLDNIADPSPHWESFRVRRRDGTGLDCEWIHLRVSDGSVIGIGRDVTSERRLEERLRLSEKLEGLAELAGGVANDFRNMLTLVLTRVELAQMQMEPEDPAQAALGEISAAAVRAATLADRLLSFSRKRPWEPRVVDLNGWLRELEPELSKYESGGILLKLELDSGCQPVSVDPKRFEEAILNLVSHARDSLPEGGLIRLMVRSCGYETAPSPVLSPGDFVVLEIEDNGSGISPEDLPRIFEPFFTSKGDALSGLGLPSAYSIVRSAGGDILVDSSPGRGTRFRVFLPLLSGQASPAPRAEDLALEAQAEVQPTILLVEDEPVLRRTVSRLVGRFGYQVVEAASGEEALERLASIGQGPLDLLLTDVVMPGINGVELARRTLALRPEIKVLFMTGFADDLLRDGPPEGAGVITKPFQKDELARKIRHCLG